MSITCQITPLAADRIRLHAPHLALQPETRQYLMPLLLALPVVTGVELQLASDSIIVKHDGSLSARAAILEALRGKTAQAAVSPVATPQAEPQPAGIGPAAPQPQANEGPYARCTPVHVMRGRVRLTIPALSKEAPLAGVLADFLGRQAGVRQVRLNRRAANIVVTYDPAALNAEALVRMIAAYDPDPAAFAHWQAAQHVQSALPVQHARRRKFEVALAAAALAVSIFGGSVAVPLVYALLLGCAGSMIQRAFKRMRKERKLALEAFAAAAMVLAGLSGALGLAALIPLLLAGAPPVVVWVQTYAPKTGARTRTATTASAAGKPVASALPTVNPIARLAVVDSDPAPMPAMTRARSLRPVEQASMVERLALGQTYTGVGNLVDTTSLSGGAARFARTTPVPSSQKAD